MAEKFL